MSKTRKPVAAGIGDSKPHIAEAGTFEPPPVRHAAGRPIGGGSLDHLLASAHSDEQQAENDKKPKARSTTVRDAFDKQLDQYADIKANDSRANDAMPEPWMGTNPMKAVADEHCPEGHVPRFLGERKVQLDGLRGWKPVIGGNGDPIKLGNMTLASMPRETAGRRNNYFRQMDRDKILEIRGDADEQTSRLAKAKGMRLAPGEVGFQRTHGNAAALEE